VSRPEVSFHIFLGKFTYYLILANQIVWVYRSEKNCIVRGVIGKLTFTFNSYIHTPSQGCQYREKNFFPL
jgi:hypothetical protein